MNKGICIRLFDRTSKKEKEFVYYYPNEDFFTDQDFLDHGHFSKEGAIKFANLVLPKIKQILKVKLRLKGLSIMK